MDRALRAEQITPADELRALLATSEIAVANLQDKPVDALALLRDMDRIAGLWPVLEAAGVDLRPEAGRWETLQASLRKRASALLRRLRATGGLPALRATHHVGDEPAWWWYLAEETRSRRRQQGVKLGVIVAGVVAIGVAITFLFKILFPVDPNLQASMVSRMDGQQKIQNQADYQGALADFQKAVDATPDDPEPWLWLGGTQQKLGDNAAAEVSFQRARALYKSEKDFLLSHAAIYIAMPMPEQARADLETVLAIDPENARAYYYLASVFELEESHLDAVNALQRASDLAEAQNDAALTAMARYRMALLMQQVQARSFALPTPTPP
ncbi:MAG: hypothetical protein CVU38_05760 [Chloroflexi bacterium HGW-Chloroflexi-1]|nr:MAG: hypothetical protein CVU38_05760 [Chloroflexi bacterium HGW-Chloroflexi-1]